MHERFVAAAFIVLAGMYEVAGLHQQHPTVTAGLDQQQLLHLLLLAWRRLGVRVPSNSNTWEL
jgi:hypothetical protein